MALITRGFRGRSSPADGRIPPGQTQVHDWPVLSAGATPRISTDEFRFTVRSDDDTEYSWDWDELHALGVEEFTIDIHCVTHWSKLGMRWSGVPLDAIFASVDTRQNFTMAQSYGGYTTNVALSDLLDGKGWIAFEADGIPLSPEHGGPARLLIPHLYFWKSAKWIRGLTMMPTDRPGFWEERGYHLHGDPWSEERYS
ncbi:DMSO/TMAO reductase YedYZ molybdopterin-dependent catalytic subunit [Mycetocola sp. CAN_C7]|uniref:molybdopterin-dependent oxidoreductase n=1 Tax=Mycetocola sp. CAN_C7 TaxID=2787724 RepID=UPI0018CA7BBA